MQQRSPMGLMEGFSRRAQELPLHVLRTEHLACKVSLNSKPNGWQLFMYGARARKDERSLREDELFLSFFFFSGG